MTRAQRIQWIREKLAYLVVYAPELPAEDGTSLDKEFDQLSSAIRDISQHVAEDRVTWLHLATAELDQSRSRFVTGESKEGRSLLQAAEQHFSDYLDNKSPRATFVVGPNGSTDHT